MKVIIAGTRSGVPHRILIDAIFKSGFTITEVVSGAAQGVDTQGEEWARHNQIPVTRFPADWHNLGTKAGPFRNAQMANYAEALIAIWDGKSTGTKNMINQGKKRGLDIYIHRINF